MGVLIYDTALHGAALPNYALDVSDPDHTAIEINKTVLRWQTIPWFPFVLALTLSMCVEAIANASIQIEAQADFNESQLVPSDEDSASSSSNSASFDDAEDCPDSSDELHLIKLLRDPSKKFYPSSGSSSSSSSTPTLGGSTMLATADFHLPERDDRVQRLVCEDSILSFSEFVCRLLRPPRDC